MGSSAAATCTSAWVSTPPVIARDSTMGNAISFLRLKGWHAPAGRRTREPRPLVQDGQIRPAPPVGARKTGTRPTDRFARQPDAASADSEVRPGPRLQTLRPYQAKTSEAGPEAQSTSSLPTLAHQGSRWPIVLGLAEHQFGARCAVSLLMSAHFRPSADTYIHATVYRGRGPILWAPGMLPDARVAAVTGKCCGGRLTSGPRR